MKLLGHHLLLSALVPSFLCSPIFSLLAGPAALPADAALAAAAATLPADAAAAAAAAAAAGGGAVALPPIIEVGVAGCAIGCSPLAKLLPLKIKGLLGLGIGLGLKALLGNKSDGQKPKGRQSYRRPYGQHGGHGKQQTKRWRKQSSRRRNHY